MARPRWINLNGEWRYAITARAATTPTRWSGTILVPFPVESHLSGVQRAVTPEQRLWYSRRFRAPTLARGERLLLHFGAVDWETSVSVNGHPVGQHRGGYDPFTFDITDALRRTGLQDLLVSVWDPTDQGPQPRGKQVLHPEGIWYTAVTGIWQTVWLEVVPAEYIKGLRVTSDFDAGAVTVSAEVTGARPGTTIRVSLYDQGREISRAESDEPASVTLPVPRPHFWSPEDPHLYRLRIALSSGDQVMSHVGMRKISVGLTADGTPRLFLNNAPLFQFGVLDQGWWPDGLYTAPTEDARRNDLLQIKRLGFNMIRKHVKVEPARWYFDADSLGLLVWQDMPSGDNDTPEGKVEFADELRHMVDALRLHPSIVMWVPFNEGWGQFDTERFTAWLQAYDTTRLVNNASGWTDHKVGDVVDLHVYPGPGRPGADGIRAQVLGEFGGLGLPIPGHTWVNRNNWGYQSFTDLPSLGKAYRGLLERLRPLIGEGLSAAVYTQATDVEIEVNGLMTYDRSIVKISPDALASAKQLFQPPPKYRTVVATSEQAGVPWRYVITQPPLAWATEGYDDSAWWSGPGGFGTPGTPGSVVRTRWNTSDIWLRRSFDLETVPATPCWRIHHDEDADIYLNGRMVSRLEGYTAGYTCIPLDRAARDALRTGSNLLAVHVHQTAGGQYIDIGLDEMIQP